MRTPAGRECDYYYEDFHRGRGLQECRVRRGEQSRLWHVADCAKCPVPEITQANSSECLQLTLTVRRSRLGFGARTAVDAWCTRHAIPVDEPRIGCPECAKELSIPEPN